MKSFHDLPVHHKVRLIILLVFAIGLVISSSGVFLYQSITYRNRAVSELISFADLAALALDSPVAWNDVKEGTKILERIRGGSGIAEAHVFHLPERRRPFLHSPADSRIPEFLLPLHEEARFVKGELWLVKDLRVGNSGPFATLVLHSRLEALQRERAWSFTVLGLVFFTLLGLSFYLASQLTRSLTRPISLLSGTVRQIAENRDFRLRAPKVSSDDIGLLADHFNRMLDVLEEQDAHLRESEQRFRSLVEEEGSLPIFGFDRNRQTIFWNNACGRLFGYSREEVMGHPLENFIVPPSLRERYLQTLEPLLEQGKVHPANEIDLMRKDGSNVPIYYSQVLVCNRYGNQEWYSVIVDLTERRRAAAEKQRLESQIQQSQKMEAIGQLAGGVAHDFNNLLQAINGYAEIVLDELPEGSSGRVEIQEIARAGQRAARLVGQLLTFSRRQILQPEILNVNRVVEEFLKLLNRVIGEHIQIDFSPCQPIGTVRADRVQMEQVLMNLCLNARDAMPKGGTLRIGTANVAVDEEFHRTHPWATPGKYVQISVSDTGCGMDADTRDRIFEPFFTTKGPGKGTGLGLAMVYGIIKQHEGIIQVYSEPGMGSTFTIFLPSMELAESASEIKKEISASGGSETLLLAEDDETVRTLAQKILRGAGYKVLIAADGSEALRVFRQHAAEIDLVLLDMIMPQLSGRAVFEEIRKDYPQLPVLFASGYSADTLQSNIRLEEDITHIQKPYSPKELLHRIRDLLDQN